MIQFQQFLMSEANKIAQHISVLQKHTTLSAYGAENKMQTGNTVN